MKKNIFTRIIAIALVAMSIMAIAIPAVAESVTRYVNVTPNLNFRQTPGGALISRIPYGEAVTQHSTTTQNGVQWSYITYNGTNGYVQTQYLSSTAPDDASSPTLQSSFSGYLSSLTSGSVNVRKSPNLDAEIYGSISSGTRTYYTFTGVGTTTNQREWLAVVYGNRYCYVYARYIGGGGAGTWNHTVSANNGLNLRTYPSTSSGSVICTLPNGTAVQIIDSTSVSGWYRITTSYGTGWVSAAYIN